MLIILNVKNNRDVIINNNRLSTVISNHIQTDGEKQNNVQLLVTFDNECNHDYEILNRLVNLK